VSFLKRNEDKKKPFQLKGLFEYLYENYFFGFPLGVFLLDLGPTLDIAHLNPM
jgi:hypothetical protein